MRIAILLASHTNSAMPQRFHDYDDMFKALFRGTSISQDFHFTTLAVVDDIFPNFLSDYDGYLILGSAYGVCDDAPFIQRLIDLIRQIHRARKPLFGVCFGHQLIALALGGLAERWHRGWVLGTTEITLANLPNWIKETEWIDGKNETIKLIHLHQDQVTKLPEGARRIGTASHCKNAAHLTDDTIFAFQGHPEFDASHTDALVSLLGERASQSNVKAARKSLSTPHDGKQVANRFQTQIDSMPDIISNYTKRERPECHL